jgi:hypothetical protein
MSISVIYINPKPANFAQLSDDATSLGISGVYFLGCKVSVAMALTNATANSDANKATILKKIDSSSSHNIVNKMISVPLPDTLDGTTSNFISTYLSDLGIYSKIKGFRFMGLERPSANNIADFSMDPVVANSIKCHSHNGVFHL